MTAITYRMNAGTPGEVTRLDTYGCLITAEKVNASAAATGAALSPASWAYGAMVLVDGNGARPIVATDTTYSPLTFGVLVRPFPGTDRTVAFPSGTVPYGAGAPPVSGVVDVLRRGYINVKNNAGTPSRTSGAFYYSGTSTGAHVQGGLEAAAGANLTQITDAYYLGAADAAGNTEMALRP